MTGQEKNTEAAAPQRPLTLGSAVYLISQPTISQMASIASVVTKRMSAQTPLALVVNDPAFKLLPAAAQTAVAIEAAKSQVTGTRPIDGMAMAREMMEPEVLAFGIWLLARGNHPALKLEDIRPLITTDNASQVYAEFNEASGMGALEEKNSAGPSG